MSVFNNLIGKRINGIFLGDDSWTLIFRDTNGKYYGYKTSGDCCNSVWVNHMSGVHLVAAKDNSFDMLRGALVVSSEERGWTDAESTDADSWDVIEDGFWCITTDRGYIDIEVRNSHNGYYGGRIEEVDDFSLNTVDDLKQVFEDF